MSEKTSYGGIDRFRIIAALLVAAIHTSPLASFGDGADFFLTRVLARVAVPFFFMVTGQFVAAEFLYGKNIQVQKEKLRTYLRKIVLLYGISILIYLPLGFYAGHYKGLNAGTAVKMFVFDGTFYHLWYFPACMMGIVLVYVMSRFLDIKGIVGAAAVLYGLGLLGDSYFGLIRDVPIISDLYNFSFRICSYTRNGIFFAPLFLVLGTVVGRKRISDRESYICYGGLAVSFLMMTGEAFLLRHLEFQRHDSMYIGLVPTMVFLYEILIHRRKKSSKVLRSLSMWIYILHPAMIVVVRGIAKILHMTEIFVDNSLMHYAGTAVLSGIVSYGIIWAGRKMKQWKGAGRKAER